MTLLQFLETVGAVVVGGVILSLITAAIDGYYGYDEWKDTRGGRG